MHETQRDQLLFTADLARLPDEEYKAQNRSIINEIAYAFSTYSNNINVLIPFS
jgi:hypothetical protein